MSEKEQIIQNLNVSQQVVAQMQELERSIDELTVKCEKKRNLGTLGAFAVFVSIVCVVIGFCVIRSDFGDGFITILIGAAAFYFGVWMKHSQYKKCQKMLAENEQQLKGLQDSSVLAWLPGKYRDSGYIRKIWEYVNTGRADTMKEVLNLLEEDIHREEMQNAALIGAYYGAQNSV